MKYFIVITTIISVVAVGVYVLAVGGDNGKEWDKEE